MWTKFRASNSIEKASISLFPKSLFSPFLFLLVSDGSVSWELSPWMFIFQRFSKMYISRRQRRCRFPLKRTSRGLFAYYQKSRAITIKFSLPFLLNYRTIIFPMSWHLQNLKVSWSKQEWFCGWWRHWVIKKKIYGLYSWGSFRFTAKFSGKYRGFQHTPYTHTGIASSTINIPTWVMHLL